MIFRQLNATSCKTYLVASERTRDAALIDPVLEPVQSYLSLLAQEGLRLRYAINTHTHADHIAGTAYLADRVDATVIMHEASPSRCVSLPVRDGSVVELGDLTLSFLHTPGHTPDSVAIVLEDRVFTGDTLFIGGAGRTDLPGGDVDQHYDSLFGKLAHLPDRLLVYPAHDYQGRESSVLGTEKETNPWFKRRSKAEYIAWLTAQAQPVPEWMMEVVKANYACAQDPRAAWVPVDAPACQVPVTDAPGVNLEDVVTISPQELRPLLRGRTGPLLLDVREPDEYVGELGHIRGAMLVPLADVSKRLPELDGARGREIVTICKGGKRSTIGAAILRQSGFSDVKSLAGGMEGWRDCGYPSTRS